jgi:hypothetical protein
VGRMPYGLVVVADSKCYIYIYVYVHIYMYIYIYIYIYIYRWTTSDLSKMDEAYHELVQVIQACVCVCVCACVCVCVCIKSYRHQPSLPLHFTLSPSLLDSISLKLLFN